MGNCPLEESPGSIETRWRLTAAGGDPRESATESKPLRPAGVRVKGCGKSAPGAWRQGPHGKPHREQDQIGMTRGFGPSLFRGQIIRVGCTSVLATGATDEWSPRRGNAALQNPAYRSTGVFLRRAFSLRLVAYPSRARGHGRARCHLGASRCPRPSPERRRTSSTAPR